MTENNQMNKGGNNEGTSVNNVFPEERNTQLNNFDLNGQNTNYQNGTHFKNVESKQNKNKLGAFFKSTGGFITAVTIALLVGFGIGTQQSFVHQDFEVETSKTSGFDSPWNDNRCPMHSF